MTAVAPIIRQSRIPLQLQAVFLASARGETVDLPPTDVSVAFKVFDSTKVAPPKGINFERRADPNKTRSPRLLFAGHHLQEFDKSKPVSRCIMKAKHEKDCKDRFESDDPALCVIARSNARISATGSRRVSC